MVELSPRAERQLDELIAFYEANARPEAIRGLIQSLQAARQQIGTRPDSGLAAPRPYPALARPGERWIKQGRYWFAYSLTDLPVVLAVFYDAANIPGRL